MVGFCLSISLYCFASFSKDSSEKNPISFSLRTNVASEEVNVFDTIPENADPKNLDLSVHQLFIDTTRTWRYYKVLRRSKGRIPKNLSSEEIIRNDQRKGVCIPKSNLPKHFLSLHRKEDTYFLYDRCDGGDAQFLIKDSLFIVFGTHESSVFLIEAVAESTDSKLTFEFTGYDDLPYSATFEKISDKRFRLTCSDEWLTTDLITPASVYSFDMLINHCPTDKVVEFE